MSVTLSFVETGYYESAGGYGFDPTNNFAGFYQGLAYRSYSSFQVPSTAAWATGVTLSMDISAFQYAGTEQLLINDVSGSQADLLGGTGGTLAFADLGDGEYAAIAFAPLGPLGETGVTHGPFTIDLGPAALADLRAAAGGGFLIGAEAPELEAGLLGDSGFYPLFSLEVLLGSPVITLLSDDSPGSVGDVLTGGLTDDTTPDFLVSVAGLGASAGDVVRLYRGAVEIVSVQLNSANIVTGVLVAANIATDGLVELTATISNADGEESIQSPVFAYMLDSIDPTISTPDLDAGSDTGPSPVDNITADNTPTFTGTAEAGAAIALYANAILVGSTTAAIDGTWAITTTALAEGIQDINATATDLAGNTTTSGYVTTLIDGSAPILGFTAISEDTGASPTDFITSDNTLIFQGTLSEAATLLVEQRLLPGGPWDIVATVPYTAGPVSFGPTIPLGDGTREFRATPTDAAGNVGTAVTLTITTDTVIATPSLPDLLAASDTGALNTDNITSLTTLDFTGTAEANSSVTLLADNVALGTVTADANGVWTITVPVTPGAHDFNVTATDLAGNSASSAFVTMVVDTTAPILSFTAISDDTGSSATDFITNDTTLVFNGSLSEFAFLKVEQQLVGGSWFTLAEGAPVLAGAVSFGPGLPLADGTRNFRATPTDIAGNTGVPVMLTITTDTIAPTAPVLAAITTDTDIAGDRVTSDRNLVFTGTAEAGSLVTLTLAGLGVIGSALADAGGAFSIDATGTTLPDGELEFTATATDLAGNSSAPSATFAVTIYDGPVNIYATNSYFQTYAGTLGNDIMFVQGNSNLLLGGYGEDGLSVYGWYNTLDGGDSNDVLIADGGFNTLHGGAGDNIMQAYGWANVFTGGNGNNIVQGLNPGGISTVTLGNGNNTVALTGWNNSITLGDGNNIVWTGDGNSTVTTGNGNNTIMAYGWNNVITTGTGNDAIAGGNGTAWIDAGGGDDQIWLGESGGSIAYGRAGDDVFYTGGGNSDSMYGGTGNDQYVLYSPWTYVIENPGEGLDTVWAGVSGYAMAANVEIGRLFGAGVSLFGNAGDEQLVANNAGLGTTLDGGAGDDVLWGNNGADTFKGGAGNDVIYSYGGADLFIYDTADWGADQISDFSAAAGDKLDLRSLWLTGIEALTIQSGNDTLVTYGTSSIYLYGVTSLTAADILFV